MIVDLKDYALQSDIDMKARLFPGRKGEVKLEIWVEGHEGEMVFETEKLREALRKMEGY